MYMLFIYYFYYQSIKKNIVILFWFYLVERENIKEMIVKINMKKNLISNLNK
jgi:hypothetical protein